MFFESIKCFNISCPAFKTGSVKIGLWTLHYRRRVCWGVGVIQIGYRHLFYVGASGVSILFIGKAYSYHTREEALSDIRQRYQIPDRSAKWRVLRDARCPCCSGLLEVFNKDPMRNGTWGDPVRCTVCRRTGDLLSAKPVIIAWTEVQQEGGDNQ